MQNMPGGWVNELKAAITVTDADGMICEMNLQSIVTFKKDGGAALVGSDILACHPEHMREKVTRLYEARKPNHYTIRVNGQRKIIHQMPWYQDGKFAGIVEISIPIPDDLPHFDRD